MLRQVVVRIIRVKSNFLYFFIIKKLKKKKKSNQIYEEGMKHFLNSFSKFPSFSTLRVDLRL